MSPKTFKSHKTTAMTTTAFKMDLIVPCIGMRLTSQSITPTTTSTINMLINGMSVHLHSRQNDTEAPCPRRYSELIKKAGKLTQNNSGGHFATLHNTSGFTLLLFSIFSLFLGLERNDARSRLGSHFFRDKTGEYHYFSGGGVKWRVIRYWLGLRRGPILSDQIWRPRQNGTGIPAPRSPKT
jgi:hypothetical protein